jgi:NCS1 family nucleobase:cation symporter-1
MVLYRAPLGLLGSLLPTICNVVQNLGWATFELFVIATAATAVSERVLGFRGRLLWVVVFGAITTVMAVAGPLTVIRRWLGRRRAPCGRWRLPVRLAPSGSVRAPGRGGPGARQL